MKRTHFVRRDVCPSCGGAVDSCDNLSQARPPRPGDFAICLKCGAANRFDAAMKLVTATAEDLREIDPANRRKLRDAEKIVIAARAVQATLGVHNCIRVLRETN